MLFPLFNGHTLRRVAFTVSLVAVSALALYDMCKAVDRGMTIDSVRLLRKSGGRSGDYRRA